MPTGNNTPTLQRQTRSGSTTGVTLNDIKVLIENLRSDVLSALKSEVDSLNATVSSLRSTIVELRENNEVLQSKYNDLSAQLQGLEPPPISTLVDEVENRARRRPNFIISGVAEPSAGSEEERTQADSSKCSEILGILGIRSDEVCDVSRIGKPSGYRDRLLRVRCKQIDLRDKALRKAKELRKHEKFRGVFINPDRTPMQQHSHNELLSELRLRKRNNEDVIIYKDRIVSRKFF